jgi:flagellar hook-basal body complex protein FliE
MSTDFIPPLTAIAAPLEPALPGIGRAAGPAAGFTTVVSEGLAQVERSVQASQGDLRALAAGDVSNLHQVMVRLEESRLSMQLMLQVRNRLLESYQEVMRMQV